MFSLVQNSEEAEFIYKFTNKNIDGLIPKLISNVSVIPKKKKKKMDRLQQKENHQN